MKTIEGTIYNIQRLSIHDGPGTRTTVFLKGCPLNCLWCCNPESQNARPEIMHFAEHCILCGKCATVCSTGAMSINPGGIARMDHSRCDGCGICIEHCMAEALSLCGRRASVDDVMRVVEKDMKHYRSSGGGMTVSGGEPTAQPKFMQGLLESAYSLGIGSCLETCGFCSWPVLEKALPFLEYVLFDLKHMNPQKHLEYTGVDNALILQNAKNLAKKRARVIIRVPFIPGINDDAVNIAALGGFMRSCGFNEVNLISYHRLGYGKYPALGRLCEVADHRDDNALNKAVDILESQNISVAII